MTNGDLIAISGLIGVGKTTLAAKLADILHAELIREEYDLNPFLPRQISGDTRAALPLELFFLLSRARQLNPLKMIPGETYLAEYIFEKNRLFAELNLDEHDLKIYNDVEQSLLPYLAAPRIVIYLTNRLETCHQRILSRGRDFEKPITLEWLVRLHEAYETLFRDWDKCRLIRLDGATLDLRRNETARTVARLILQDHHISKFP